MSGPVTLSTVLSEDGPIARTLGPAFESRPEQLQMAAAVARAMEEKSHLLVEAGTGVGKSFAYLVPAILRALNHGEVVVVVTNTISLQEQLVRKDIPLLQSLLDPDPAPGAAGEPAPRRLKPVLVKGRGNYVSIRRLRMASERQERLFSDAASRRSLHVIQEWALDTHDGTLSTLPPLERPGVWDRVQSDSGNCMGKRCPNNADCFFQNARRAMDGANLLVCNHALFFSDLALRAQEVGFLPRYQHVILDEAHHVEDVAAEHFGVSLGEGRVNHLLRTLYEARTGRGYLSQLAVTVHDHELIEKTIRAVADAQEASREFFEALLTLNEGADGEESGAARAPGRARPGRVRRPGVVPNTLSPAIQALAVHLRALRELTNHEPDRFELNAYAIRAGEIAADAATLIDQTMPGCAYWVEVSGGDDGPGESSRYRRVTLACSPVEVAPLLKERLFSEDHSVVLTSATLAVRTVRDDENTESGETAFAHTISRLGCEGARTLQLGSPFDHARQLRLIVDRSVPDHKHPVYVRALAERVAHHVAETDGGAFVLFTSFATLNAVARLIAEPLHALGLPLLVQGAGGSRSHILERFRADERSVLLGAASFWQGVDVRGRGLRNVIITKLPFEPPDRPLTEARLERIEQRGGNPFVEDSLPRAIIMFKQGFGRLIRSKTDTGRVVVLDPRIVTARYGKRFLDALPSGIQEMKSDREQSE